MKPIVIFENDPDFAAVLERHLHNAPQGSYFIFPGYEEFEKSGLKPSDVSTLFLDHHLDGVHMGNDVLAEFNEQGFAGKAYSMDNFNGQNNTYYQRMYTRNFPAERYQIVPKLESLRIGELMREAISNEWGSEGEQGELGQLK